MKKILKKLENSILGLPNYTITNINKFKNRLGKRGVRIFKNISFCLLVMAIGGTSTVVLAADDPLTVVNNLSNFIITKIQPRIIKIFPILFLD